MNWLKRTIRNWLGVSGDSSYPHRFVTIVNYQDKLLAVDGNGDIYVVGQNYLTNSPAVQLLMKNPLER